MISLRARNIEDETHDMCGNTAVAILEIDRIKIPLCDDCMECLGSDLIKFRSTIFCRECKSFIPIPDGIRGYDGICLYHRRDTDFLDTCTFAESK